MWGPPKDVEGQCNARLFLADDYGDNTLTIRCQLPAGHDGVHLEKFTRDDDNEVAITWDKDERNTDNDPNFFENDFKDESAA